ncbi:alkaline phosphatase D family protein [Chitinivorax sp. B]|uniref:alkaline phosphatase D family protein n=1 Tax=Chitinivorax sp. B TaxID=2502235 RepID=UPI0010F903E5|nr:alkaline phosphatase D family protein [Chitinivorax sp. B]
MDRRQFMKLAGSLTVISAAAGLTGCQSSVSGGDSPDDFDLTKHIQQAAQNGSAPNRPGAGVYKFPQSIASGDPKADSAVFWTRALRADGVVGDVPMKLALSKTADFRLIQFYDVIAKLDLDGTVRVKITGLEADQTYYFCFVADRDVSPTGRARTLPAADADLNKLKLAFISGLDWSYNHWQGASILTDGESDIDFLVLLGDGLSALVPPEASKLTVESTHRPLSLPNGLTIKDKGKLASSLDDFRYLYRTYRADARLQALFARYTLLPVWGDQEFAPDAWQDHEGITSANEQQTQRRQMATLAWLENLPVDWNDLHYTAGAAGFQQIRLYRDFHWGTLLHLLLTEQRLARSDHAIREDLPHLPGNQTGALGARHMVVSSVMQNSEPVGQTLLGMEQKAWVKETLRHSTARWKVLGGESSLLKMSLNLAGQQSVDSLFQQSYLLSADQWDGYDAERRELVGFIRDQQIQNVISLSAPGAFMAGEVWGDYRQARNPVMLDFATAGMSAPSLLERIADMASTENVSLSGLLKTASTIDQMMAEQNSTWLQYVKTGVRGYTVMTFLKDKLVVEYIELAEVSNGLPPINPFRSQTTMFVTPGKLQIDFPGRG